MLVVAVVWLAALSSGLVPSPVIKTTVVRFHGPPRRAERVSVHASRPERSETTLFSEEEETKDAYHTPLNARDAALLSECEAFLDEVSVPLWEAYCASLDAQVDDLCEWHDTVARSAPGEVGEPERFRGMTARDLLPFWRAVASRRAQLERHGAWSRALAACEQTSWYDAMIANAMCVLDPIKRDAHLELFWAERASCETRWAARVLMEILANQKDRVALWACVRRVMWTNKLARDRPPPLFGIFALDDDDEDDDVDYDEETIERVRAFVRADAGVSEDDVLAVFTREDDRRLILGVKATDKEIERVEARMDRLACGISDFWHLVILSHFVIPTFCALLLGWAVHVAYDSFAALDTWAPLHPLGPAPNIILPRFFDLQVGDLPPWLLFPTSSSPGDTRGGLGVVMDAITQQQT